MNVCLFAFIVCFLCLPIFQVQPRTHRTRTSALCLNECKETTKTVLIACMLPLEQVCLTMEPMRVKCVSPDNNVIIYQFIHFLAGRIARKCRCFTQQSIDQSKCSPKPISIETYFRFAIVINTDHRSVNTISSALLTVDRVTTNQFPNLCT